MAKTPRRARSGGSGLNRAGQWWLAAGALVVGVVLGAIAVGLLSEGSPSPSQLQADAEAASNAAGSPGPSSAVSTTAASGATAEVIVNDACLRAVNAAQNALSAFQDIGEAARSFNAAELDSIIRRLQPLQSTLLDDVNACKVTTRLPNGVTVASSLPGSAGVDHEHHRLHHHDSWPDDRLSHRLGSSSPTSFTFESLAGRVLVSEPPTAR